MDKGLFYINFNPSEEKQALINEIEKYSAENSSLVYIVNRPLGDQIYEYNYEKAIVVLIPKYKILFINFETYNEEFSNYIEDFIEDIGYISQRYGYKDIMDRPRNWKKNFLAYINIEDINNKSFNDLLNEYKLVGEENIRKGEILMSLFTDNINDVNRINGEVPNNILDKIKKKIILRDGEQTRFIFNEPNNKRVTIQGLAGTGKTELLLHKIKKLYLIPKDLKIVFTCHNVILADNLRRNRVNEFFNFMRVEEQIKWNEKLWVMRSWGSQGDKNSGVYSYICNHYNIPFQRFTYNNTFDSICKQALEYIEKLENFDHCFDYMLIDESQDFSESFFQLCEKVTKFRVYLAGDIFQDIFESKPVSTVNPDFLLNRCYRTDPKTLMGAHAIGMGLFEQKLRWLEDDEWEACGYDIKKENGYYNLSRKPLQRFEDFDNNVLNGIQIIQIKNFNYEDKIIEIIDNIIKDYPTVKAGDIGIMFLENIESNYKLATRLQILIKEKFDWNVNIGYETKIRSKDEVFISNRNNVKGLEFPFVICIMQTQLGNDFQLRNSIYMMLTRSFLNSYFIIPKIQKYEKEIIKGIEFVNHNNYLHISEPTSKERNKLKNAIINYENIFKSQYDIVEEIANELKIDKNKRKQIHQLIQTICQSENETDKDKIKEIILSNIKFI